MYTYSGTHIMTQYDRKPEASLKLNEASKGSDYLMSLLM